MFCNFAPKLIENGWRNLLPLARDKAPVVKWAEWQHRDQTLDELRALWKANRTTPLLGLIFGPERGLVAIDVDIADVPTNALVCDIAADILGLTHFLRIGRSPKFMAFFRGKVRSRKLHPIEIFGSSGQVAAFGLHPVTGKPYDWPACSLLGHRLEDLPEVTQAQVDAFLDECQRHAQPRDASGRAIDWFDFDALSLERKMDGYEGAARQIMRVSEGNRHLVLLSVVGFLIDKGHAPDAIGRFVDKYFPTDLRTEDWSEPGARAEQMAARTAAKFFTSDWELKE